MNNSKRVKSGVYFLLFIGLFCTLPNLIHYGTATSAPTIISPINGAYLKDNTPTVTWTIVVGATNYEIELAIDQYFTQSYGTTTTPNPSYTAPIPMPDDLYYIRVRANSSSGGGWSLWSQSRSFTIDTVPPAPLQNPIYPVMDGYATEVRPQLDWSSQSNVDHYQIWLDDNSNMGSLLINTNFSVSEYLIQSDLLEIDYYWQIRAQDLAGNLGDWSPLWHFIVDSIPPGTPDLISPLNETNTQNPIINFTWSEIPDSINYLFQIANSSDFNPVLIETQISDSNYTFELPVNEVEYFWRVAAIDQAGNQGSWSNHRTILYDSLAPPRPILRLPLNSSYINHPRVYFEWDNEYQRGKYEFAYSWLSSMQPATVVTYLTDPNYDRTFLDGQWYWSVRNRDGSGNIGEWSEIWTFIVDTIGPVGPDLLQLIDFARTNQMLPTFKWVASESSFFQFHLQLDVQDTFISPILNETSLMDSSYTSLILLDEGLYYWRVRTMDLASNWGNWSDIESFVVDTTGPLPPELVSPLEEELLISNVPMLVWDPIIDGTQYQIRLDNTSAFTEHTVIYISNHTHIRIPIELPSGIYYWAVRTQDIAGNWGEWGNTRSFRIVNLPTNTSTQTTSTESNTDDSRIISGYSVVFMIPVFLGIVSILIRKKNLIIN